MDYPDLLIQAGITGVSSLDLYFDLNGGVDESKSEFAGSNAYVRGLLVRAVRKGLVAWYRSDGGRLEKDQFRGQHFRASFTISFVQAPETLLTKTVNGHYSFKRRAGVTICATPSGVDLACLAIQGYGKLRSVFSDKYRIQVIALKERLEDLDRLGLQGISRQF